MVCILDQVRSRIAGQGQELTGMTAFAAADYKIVNRRTKCCRRREIALISSIGTVAHDAFAQCRDVIKLLTNGSGRHIGWIAVVAGFASAGDARMHETLCRFKRISGGVARIAILIRRQMGSWFSVECVTRRAEVTIMAGRAVVGIYADVVKRRDRKARMHNTQSTVAIGAILDRTERRRKVIKELSNTDHIVVACRTIIYDTGMVIGSSCKGTRGMAKPAILGGQYMVGVHTARRSRPVCNMAGIAASRQDHRIGMIDPECWCETVSVMATRAVGTG